VTCSQWGAREQEQSELFPRPRSSDEVAGCPAPTSCPLLPLSVETLQRSARVNASLNEQYKRHIAASSLKYNHPRAQLVRAECTKGPQTTTIMSLSHSVLWSPATVHDTRLEGFRLGLIVGTATWLWVAAVDVVATGRPFHTFSALGGVLVVTVVHYLLNITYGMVLLSFVHGAARTPSLIIGALFGTLLFEVAFAMLTIILAQYALGTTAWLAIFGGSLIGTALAVTLLAQTHPLVAYLRCAEEET
jgi:hypothetical protein